MIFNSIEFLIFSLLFFILWPLARIKNSSRWGFIVSASFVFYGWWDWRFLFLIIFSGMIDYLAGLSMVKYVKKKRLILFISLFANFGSLFIFKYSVFFATVTQDLFAFFDVRIYLINKIPEFALILPVGISFYTFQSLSYTIDIYKNRLAPTKNILHFFSYLSMFPQLVAGPIVRAKDLLIQLTRYKIPNYTERWNAIKLIIYGLFQKVVIADNLSYFIDSAYEGKSIYSGTLYWWFVAIAFSFQIYADFSGYSSIARGLAKFMGYHFKMNFDHPYLSTSIRMFWSRWHISLSTWFRDYVYIPLGGSQKGIAIGMVALTITMMLSGIWHGANYTFLIWAGLHTVYLIIERTTNYTGKLKNFSVILILIVFIQVTLAWVYFRASSIHEANTIIGYLFDFSDSNVHFINAYFDNLVFLFLAILIELTFYTYRKNKSKFQLYKKHQSNIDAVLLGCCIILIIFFRGEGAQFIYFQF